ncbi:unnamed protein product, partial [Ectocarpus sp. 4 AP-2014]
MSSRAGTCSVRTRGGGHDIQQMQFRKTVNIPKEGIVLDRRWGGCMRPSPHIINLNISTTTTRQTDRQTDRSTCLSRKGNCRCDDLRLLQGGKRGHLRYQGCTHYGSTAQTLGSLGLLSLTWSP